MLHQTENTAKKENPFNLTRRATSARRRGGAIGVTRAVLESLEDRRLLSSVLGTAASFAVLGASTVTNTGASDVVGNLGVSPGSAATGFPPGVISGGTIHVADAVAIQAHADVVTAYDAIAGEASPAANGLSGQNLGGLTLAPGVYHFSTSAVLTGTLTLDAQGDPNARFDFQIGTTLITANNSAIHLINGAHADNIYFQVGTSATLGTDTAFEGNLLAHQSITMTTGASLSEGRAMTLVGAVTLDTNQVTAVDADVSLTDTAAAGPVVAGNAVTYTITVANAGPDDAQTVAMTDPIPAGTTFVSATQTSGPAFNLSRPAVGGNGTIRGTIGNLASETSATFQVAVRVPISAPTGTNITNTGNVTTDTNDRTPANNSQSVTTSAVASPPLFVSVNAPETTDSAQPAIKILGVNPSTANDSDLTYTWSVAAAPSGAKQVQFSANGTHAAKSLTVRFHKAGTYHLLCTVTNIHGSATRLVSITIKQVATKLHLTPHHLITKTGETIQYAGAALDQFGHPMRTTSTTTYAVQSGVGTIDDGGLFSTGKHRGHAVIQITADGLVGTLGATVS